jgi:hypothetical protein
MGEVHPIAYHRREGERLLRLAELTTDVHLKLMLTRAGELHCKIARDLDRLNGFAERGDSDSRRNGGNQTLAYRLHFLDQKELIAVHEFDADSDIAALTIAFAIHDASSDVHQHFELWQDRRVLMRSADRRGARRPRNLENIAVKMHQRLLEVQEALLNGDDVFASSRRLRAATERLRKNLPRSG